MGKKKKISKLRITESVQEKLDSINEVESTDVYKPKEEENIGLQFLEILGEEEFSTSNQELKIRKSKPPVNIRFIDIFLILVAIIGLIGIVLIMIKLQI